MRRRRKTRGTWFPNIGTANNDEDNLQGRFFQLNFPGGSEQILAISPLTFDEPRTDDTLGASDASLADVIGSEYVLQRIVGKLFIARHAALTTVNGSEVDAQPAVLVSAGFFVARANDTASGGGINTPIGSASAAEARDNYSPLEVDTVREPWIWRRTWVLGASPTGPNNLQPANAQSALRYPPSTAWYGSVADGPHIDSKVKRRVRQDQRLWFSVSACTYPPQTAVDTGQLAVLGYLDYRLFGSLRKAQNSSAF